MKIIDWWQSHNFEECVNRLIITTTQQNSAYPMIGSLMRIIDDFNQEIITNSLSWYHDTIQSIWWENYCGCKEGKPYQRICDKFLGGKSEGISGLEIKEDWGGWCCGFTKSIRTYFMGKTVICSKLLSGFFCNAATSISLLSDLS